MVHIRIKNNTTIDFEIKSDRICACVTRILLEEEIDSLAVICDDVGYKTPNFTTSGIYCLHGTAKLANNENKSWSVIVKVIKPDSAEKNFAEHHNYWRREAHVFNSGILNELPDSIKVARCFWVEELPDETIWIWMEHIQGEHADTVEHFSFIAGQLGRFNAAYLTGINTLPKYDWLCSAWLKSWTTASRLFAPHVDTDVEGLSDDHYPTIWAWYQKLIRKLDFTIESLQRLPRVLAHQDLSQKNMFLTAKGNSTSQLVLIDWQFLSISGIGEDLGKLFGVNMSLGIIQPNQYDEFQRSLYTSYLEGLRSAGWQGDEKLMRYGFYLSTALRSVWEVPQYFSILAQLDAAPQNHNLKNQLYRLERILMIQKNMYSEVELLMPELGFCTLQ
ncbi:phosphotransferase [Paenibacillus sp. FJAT-26967]|uniref:phosphotransferase n=1 Tax=Paenibacillus sp. FJAT-26967 TaxID=1729690 RepID=UPI0008392F3E|nr:phosphotransferase [Paenibacillus sp. FJAT-26967]